MNHVLQVILTRAASAATVDTLDNPSLLQFVLGHAADAVGCEVRVTSLEVWSWCYCPNVVWSISCHLNAAQAAKILIALLLPFCNQVGICNLLLEVIHMKSFL